MNCYAVIFTSERTDKKGKEYANMSKTMVEIAKLQPGFIKVESVRNNEGHGITVSYWETLEDIQNWKKNASHRVAQENGKDIWYSIFSVEICKVVKSYSFKKE